MDGGQGACIDPGFNQMGFRSLGSCLVSIFDCVWPFLV